MKKLTINQMENFEGANNIGVACAEISSGSAVYAIGITAEFWNSVGWVSGALLAIDAACAAYSAHYVLKG